jgi:hypothetical protein
MHIPLTLLVPPASFLTACTLASGTARKWPIVIRPRVVHNRKKQKATLVVDDALGGDAVLAAAALTTESMENSAVQIEAVPLESLVPDEAVPEFYAPLL